MAIEIIIRLDAVRPFSRVNAHMVPMNMSTENPISNLVSGRGSAANVAQNAHHTKWLQAMST